MFWPGRFSERVQKWTTAKSHTKYDVFSFFLVPGCQIVRLPDPPDERVGRGTSSKITPNLPLQSQQLDKFDFDKFHQNIEDAKSKGGQVHFPDYEIFVTTCVLSCTNSIGLACPAL